MVLTAFYLSHDWKILLKFAITNMKFAIKTMKFAIKNMKFSLLRQTPL